MLKRVLFLSVLLAAGFVVGYGVQASSNLKEHVKPSPESYDTLFVSKLLPMLEARSEQGGVTWISGVVITRDCQCSRNHEVELVIGIPDGASDLVPYKVKLAFEAIDHWQLEGDSIVVFGTKPVGFENSVNVKQRIRVFSDMQKLEFLSELEVFEQEVVQ